MQTTTTTTQIHVKASLDNEFRRFALNPPTFLNLFTTLKTLFNLDKEFRIKFQDDEKDWVLLSTDQELLYAHELAGSPLRLDIKIIHESVSATSPSEDACRGGRGRSRGRGGRVGANLSKEERLTLKSNRLASRIAELETKINSGHLNSDRDRVLRWRLGNLQNKLKFVQLAKETLQTTPGADVSSPSSTTETHPFCGFRGRGRGRGGRFCARMPPEVVENFRKCKSDLQAARDSGNQEQIDSCFAALQLAKKQKQEARAKLFEEGQTTDQERRCPWRNKARVPPEIIANFRKCKFNLKVARESGNQEQIDSCLAALQLAKKQKQEILAKLLAEEEQAKANLSSEEKEDQKETTPCDAPCTGTSTM